MDTGLGLSLSNSSSALPKSSTSAETLKEQLQLENETYLKEHPEIRGIMSLFMARVLEEKPKDVQKFTLDFFTAYDLKDKVHTHMGEL